VLALTAVLAAQGVHPLSGRQYAQTMGVEGADWLDRAERDQEEDPDRAIDVLKLQKGATVADIGAGSGYMTEKLSKKVGPMGKVFATDIQPGMIADQASKSTAMIESLRSRPSCATGTWRGFVA